MVEHRLDAAESTVVAALLHELVVQGTGRGAAQRVPTLPADVVPLRPERHLDVTVRTLDRLRRVDRGVGVQAHQPAGLGVADRVTADPVRQEVRVRGDRAPLGVPREPAAQLGVELGADGQGVVPAHLVPVHLHLGGVEVEVLDLDGGELGGAGHEEQAARQDGALERVGGGVEHVVPRVHGDAETGRLRHLLVPPAEERILGGVHVAACPAPIEEGPDLRDLPVRGGGRPRVGGTPAVHMLAGDVLEQDVALSGDVLPELLQRDGAVPNRLGVERSSLEVAEVLVAGLVEAHLLPHHSPLSAVARYQRRSSAGFGPDDSPLSTRATASNSRMRLSAMTRATAR